MTKRETSSATGPQAALAAMEHEAVARYVAGESSDPAQFIARLEDRAALEELEEFIPGKLLGASRKVLVIAPPRPNDPMEKRVVWVGLVLSVVEPNPGEWNEVSDRYLWVDFDDTIRQIRARGEIRYANFLRECRKFPERRIAPGLLIERSVCTFVSA